MITMREVRSTFATAPVAEFEDLAGAMGVMIIAPHPDDESLGCGGLIALASRRGVPVTVVVMTDGTASHPDSPEYPAPRLEALRIEELRAALKELGQQHANIVLLRFPDGRMDAGGPQGDAAVQKLRDLIDRENIGSIYCTWDEDPHPDHQASFAIARRVSDAKPSLRFFAYPIWALDLPDDQEIARSLGDVYRLNVSAVLEAKQRAIACHRSQLSGLIDDDPKGFRLQPEVLELFAGRFETFIEQSGPKRVALRSVDPDHFNRLYAKSIDPWSYVDGDYETHRFDTIMDLLPRHAFGVGLNWDVRSAS